MANETIRARIEVLLKGLDQVESLKNAVRQLQGTAAPASADLEKLKNAAMQLGSASGRTENDLRRSINALKDVRAQLGLADVEYRKLTRTINNYQAQLDKATGAQQRAGKGMQFAQTAGAVAASGVFGGPEGLVGAGIGAFFGPGGALAGGAIGAQVGIIRQQLGATATLAADLEKQRTALRLVLKDTAEYNSAISFLSKVSKDYAIPQDRLIKGFTQLAASVKGAGGNIADTKTAFEGVSAGIRGTGGSLENLDAALLATSQVFSKGKVTAEELRGQIGERLPGAFTLFAQSIGKTPQELDKALEKGEVGLDDFLKFAKTVFGEYGENAKIIADSPAAAGDRLQTNLKNLSESVGKLLQPVGAAFQDTFSDIVKYIDQAARSLGDFLGLNRSSAERVGDLNNQIITQQRAIQRERDKLRSGQTTKEAAEYSIREFEGRIAKLRGELGVLRGLDKASQQQQKDKPSALAGTGGGGKTDLDKQALAKLENERLRREADEQKTNESIAKNRIALDDTVNRNALELIRKRYEYEQELINKQRDNWVKSQTGAARSAAGLISGFFGEIQKIQDRVLQAQDAVASAQQGLKSAEAMSSVTVGGTGGSQVTQGYISKEVLRKWLISQGMGRTSGDFTNAGHRTPNHMLNAMDMGFTSSRYDQNYVQKTIEMERKLRATGAFGNQLFGPERDPRGHKDHLHVPTPGGQVKLTPGLANLMGMSGAGAGAAGRRDINAEGSVEVMNANLQKSQQELKLTEENVKKLMAAVGEGFVLDFTDQIRQQNAALKDSAEITGLRNRLELEGVRPELIDNRIKQAEAAQRIARENGIATQALKALTDAGKENSVEAQRLRDGVAANNVELAEFTRLTNEATAAQIAFNDAMRFRQDMNVGAGLREGAESYIESIGTMREATAQLAQTGIKGVEDAIFSLVTTGKANFREFAADILKQTARMIIQQMILRVLLQAIGGIGGGFGGGGGIGSLNANIAQYAPLPNAMGNAFAKNNILPFAMGGIVDKPTLFKFANGGAMRTGLMGEAGPEAIVPLKRGRDGKLGVASSGGGGGDINVSVSVDASGSQVQGNSSQGEQLGRAVAQAVQAELVRQKRPGGLLAA